MENVEYFQAKKREVTLRFRIEKDVVDQLCQNKKNEKPKCIGKSNTHFYVKWHTRSCEAGNIYFSKPLIARTYGVLTDEK
jgi:hypothetical protein